uniref:Uncharacterized protein n=1 Tax=Aegilops tauschii subsp. strangulata TaxID=200361 RepID=A0A452YZ12_AEGTS
KLLEPFFTVVLEIPLPITWYRELYHSDVNKLC